MAFFHTRKVYLSDTDAAGVVYFASVMNMCHEAYEESLAASGISLQQFLQDSKIAIPIVQAEVNFFRPLFCGDKILIELVTKQLNDYEFAIDYQIFSTTQPSKNIAQGKTKHVCINPQTRKRVEFPESICQWLQFTKQ